MSLYHISIQKILCIMYHKANEKKLHSKFKCSCLWSTLHSPIQHAGRRFFRRLHATQRQNNETPWKKGDRALNYVYLDVGACGCTNVCLSDGKIQKPLSGKHLTEIQKIDNILLKQRSSFQELFHLSIVQWMLKKGGEFSRFFFSFHKPASTLIWLNNIEFSTQK